MSAATELLSPPKAPTHYTLRYFPGTDLNKAKHVHTLVQIPFGEEGPTPAQWIAAEDARLALPAEVGDLLEVVER